MLMNLLKAVPSGGKDIGIGEAALDALIGYIVVFLGIAFLILVVWAVGRIMASMDKTSKKANAKKEAVESVKLLPTQSDSEEISEETLAVITAALMAYYEANNPKCEFTVKRIKRI